MQGVRILEETESYREEIKGFVPYVRTFDSGDITFRLYSSNPTRIVVLFSNKISKEKIWKIANAKPYLQVGMESLTLRLASDFVDLSSEKYLLFYPEKYTLWKRERERRNKFFFVAAAIVFLFLAITFLWKVPKFHTPK